MTSRFEKTDEELLMALAQEDSSALDELYRRHSPRVLGYALKRGLSKERAEDVLQIVFLQIYRKRHLYKPEHAALAWLFVITKSELKDYRNREGKDLAPRENEMALSQTSDPAPSLMDGQEARDLLASLPERERSALEGRYLREEDFDEIADRLQTSAANVRQLVSRALRKLRGQS